MKEKGENQGVALKPIREPQKLDKLVSGNPSHLEDFL